MNTKKIDANILYASFIKAGFKTETAKILTAQAAHETSNFTSTLYKDFNNAAGMKQPTQRKTLSGGAWYGYATFKNVQTFADDFMIYWKVRKLPAAFKTITEYIEQIKKIGYFEDPYIEYLKGVNYFYDLYFKA